EDGVIDGRNAERVQQRQDSVRARPWRAAVDEQRLARRRDDQRAGAGSDVNEVDVGVARLRLRALRQRDENEDKSEGNLLEHEAVYWLRWTSSMHGTVITVDVGGIRDCMIVRQEASAIWLFGRSTTTQFKRRRIFASRVARKSGTASSTSRGPSRRRKKPTRSGTRSRRFRRGSRRSSPIFARRARCPARRRSGIIRCSQAIRSAASRRRCSATPTPTGTA